MRLLGVLLLVASLTQDHKTAYSRAMTYVKANYKKSGVAGHVYAGFAFMMDESKSCAAELQDCVRFCSTTIREKGLNRNWHVALSLFFLAEHATKFGLTAETKNALTEACAIAAREQEPTGGWCHYKGMAKERNYVEKLGGGDDIVMLTAMIYAACLEMKALGMNPGPMMEKAQKNLESLSDGLGYYYGTRATWSKDPCLARASTVLLALLATGETNEKFIEGLDKRYTKCEEGHAFGPINYFATGAAMHRLGQYKKFSDEYLGRLIKSQRADGVVCLGNDGKPNPNVDAVASTAVFACLLAMEKDGVFVPKPKKKR